MRNYLLALAGMAACAVITLPVNAEPPPGAAPAAPAGAGRAEAAADGTRPFRKPAELIAKCGSVTVKDLGLWPDFQTAFENGEPLEIAGCPSSGSINARGQAVVVLDAPPKDGVSRSETDGVVQYAVKRRPATGKINSRGDVLGQLLVENPDGGAVRLKHQAFFLGADSTVPSNIDVRDGASLTVAGLNEDGLGVGNLSGSQNSAVFIVRDAQSGAITLKPVIDRAKLPPRLASWGVGGVNKQGDTLLNLSHATGKMNSALFPNKGAKPDESCSPYMVDTLSECAIARNGEIELIPVPEGVDGMTACALTDGGVVVGEAEVRQGDAHSLHGFTWTKGVYRKLESFEQLGVSQPSDADAMLACGTANVPIAALGMDPKKSPPARLAAFYELMRCGVLWDLETGTVLPLDSLLPEGGACTHISSACAIKGDKLLCTGLIDGKMHGLVVTLPPKVREGFKKGL